MIGNRHVRRSTPITAITARTDLWRVARAPAARPGPTGAPGCGAAAQTAPSNAAGSGACNDLLAPSTRPMTLVLHEHLHALGDAGRKLAPPLHGSRDRPRAAFRAASGRHRMLAAATASCTARLTPTPPIGDIACAASPMQSRPGRCQRSSRSTATVSSLTCSQSLSSSTRSANAGMSRATLRRNAGSPARRGPRARPSESRRRIASNRRDRSRRDAPGGKAAHGLVGVAGSFSAAGTRAHPSARRDPRREPGACADDRTAAVASDREVGLAPRSTLPAVSARTPVTRPPSSIRSTASACMRKWNDG